MTKATLAASLLLSTLGTTLWAQQPAPQPPQSERQAQIERLVEELGDDDYATREAAQKSLEKLGTSALPALKKASKSSDPEVASRASEAMETIQTGRRGQRPQPARPDPRTPPPLPGPVDPDEVLKELQRQLPKGFRELFKDLFGQEQVPGQDEERNRESRNRTRVWTWSNTPKPQAAGLAGELGLNVGPCGRALRAQLELPRGEGMVVNQLTPKGYAAARGVQMYDIILTRDDRVVQTLQDLKPLLEKGGKLEVLRKAKQLTLTLTPRKAAPPTPPKKPAEGKPGEPKERSF